MRHIMVVWFSEPPTSSTRGRLELDTPSLLCGLQRGAADAQRGDPVVERAGGTRLAAQAAQEVRHLVAEERIALEAGRWPMRQHWGSVGLEQRRAVVGLVPDGPSPASEDLQEVPLRTRHVVEVDV